VVLFFGGGGLLLLKLQPTNAIGSNKRIRRPTRMRDVSLSIATPGEDHAAQRLGHDTADDSGHRRKYVSASNRNLRRRQGENVTDNSTSGGASVTASPANTLCRTQG